MIECLRRTRDPPAPLVEADRLDADACGARLLADGHGRHAGTLGGLASAGIAATALSLLHELDATIMVLVWNLGAAVLIVALGGIFGRRLLHFASPPASDG